MRYEEREFITMYQIDYTNVGKRMKTLRKQAGYTQEQIADALDVTVAFISNIENDRVKMNLRVLSYYAKLLNVSIDYLLRPESDENGEKDNVLNKEILRLLEKFSTDDKEKFVKVLRILSKEQIDTYLSNEKNFRTCFLFYKNKKQVLKFFIFCFVSIRLQKNE